MRGFADPEASGEIYYILRNGHVKIGFSARLGDRLRRMEKGGDIRPVEVGLGPLLLIGRHPGTPVDEDRLHKLFAADRVLGEWFLLSPAVSQHIHRLNISNPPCEHYHGPFTERPNP